jgi:hypothetical protein
MLGAPTVDEHRGRVHLAGSLRAATAEPPGGRGATGDGHPRDDAVDLRGSGLVRPVSRQRGRDGLEEPASRQRCDLFGHPAGPHLVAIERAARRVVGAEAHVADEGAAKALAGRTADRGALAGAAAGRLGLQRAAMWAAPRGRVRNMLDRVEDGHVQACPPGVLTDRPAGRPQGRDPRWSRRAPSRRPWVAGRGRATRQVAGTPCRCR